MKKLLIYLAMLFVFAIWGVATIRIYQIQSKGKSGNFFGGIMKPSKANAAQVPVTTPTASTTTVSSSIATSSSSTAIANDLSTDLLGKQAMRKIGFTFRDPKAKQVLIKLEFEGWKSQTMIKGENGVWTYTAAGNFPPGEYAYYFEVDGRKIPKDPANKRTKKIGPVILSAVIVKPSE